MSDPARHAGEVFLVRKKRKSGWEMCSGLKKQPEQGPRGGKQQSMCGKHLLVEILQLGEEPRPERGTEQDTVESECRGDQTTPWRSLGP